LSQSEFIGFGEISRLGQILSERGSRRVFLVTGRDSFRKCGAEKTLEDILDSVEVCQFNNFLTNPKLQDVLSGIDQCLSFKPDTVVAIGGGSVIDVAKGIRFLGTHPKRLGAYDLEPKLPEDSCRTLIAIPTTAGSGSESTHFSVVYVDGQKHSVADKSVLPEVAIVDPSLTMTLSPYQTAVSGMDALSQAIESYWSVHSTEASKEFAKEAIRLIMQSLVQTVNDPSTESRLKMAQAAHLSGKAINISKTTTSHAISYPITSYFGIPHGHAVALTLPLMLIFNSQVTDSDTIDRRGADYVKTAIEEICQAIECDTVVEAAQFLDDLMTRIGLQSRLHALGLKPEDLDLIVAHGLDPQRAGNNPRTLMSVDLREMLQRIY
jgi:alcohol dehydrogenase class IV